MTLILAVNWEAISAMGQIVGALAANSFAARRQSVAWRTGRASASSRVVLSRHPGLQISQKRRSRTVQCAHGSGVLYLSRTVFPAVGRASRSAPVGSDRSGHARYQRISWSSSLVAYTLASVQ